MKDYVSWFLTVHQNGQLDLEPPYQRRSAWTLKDRKYFLDTIFRNYPCPAIFLHKEMNRATGQTNYHVVDGKQRLETILLFSKNKITIDPGYGDTQLNGKTWKEIETDPVLRERFLTYELTVEYITTTDKHYINEVFERLNRTSRRLQRQELRHAKYDGWFITMAEKEAETEYWEHLGVVTKARMRRMKDVQCISELLTVLLKKQIVGYSQDELDGVYAEYDSPDETFPDFNEDEFRRRLDLTKDYVLEMEHHNRAVTKYARGFNDFYSLWSFVALHHNELPSPEIAAQKYSEFMDRIMMLTKAKDVELLRGSAKAYPDACHYLQNSGRAGTDQFQREARDSALGNHLLIGQSQREVVALTSTGVRNPLNSQGERG
jgi:hypothetical protein